MKKTVDPMRVKPAPVNDEIYSPINTDSDEFQRLAASIRDSGLLEPIHITSDWVVISGHRRLKACQILGLESIPVIIHKDVESGSDEHIRLLVEANSQRVKTAEMMIREAATLADPETVHQEFMERRTKLQEGRDLFAADVEDVEWGGRKRARGKVTKAKTPMLTAAQKIINDNQKYWPLSVRQVHYRLLNDPPLKHASKPDSAYQNDRRSYQNLSELLTMARIDGLIPWYALADETRPEIRNATWDHSGPYVTRELGNLFARYQRDLLQDQDDHIVVLAEKLTVAGILRPVCLEFCVPLIIGRGYADIGTRHNIAMDFRRSGKRRLLLIFVNDHDPEGCNIPRTVCQSLNEDFGIDWRRVIAKRAAITKDQAESFELETVNTAKETSSRFDGYVDETGGTNIWELEALEPADLAAIVTDAIKSCLDLGKFNAQVEREKLETKELSAMAAAARRFFQKPD